MKSHLSFWLKAPKKLVITIRKSLNGAFTWNLMIWLKRLIFTIWLSKEMVAHFQGLFLKKWILWKSNILKRFIFLVPEYGNLIGVKTRRDRLENSRECILERGVQIFDFGEGKGPHVGFRCCLVVALSFFCLLRPWGFRNFVVSALDCPFRVFTLELCFFFFCFLHFSLSYYALENSKFIPNGWMLYQDDFGWKFPKEKPLQSKYPHLIQMDFLDM